MTKYKHRIDTLDGPLEYESDTPQPPHKTPEILEAERVKRYPTEDKASYLLYTCNYCLDEFYLIHPDRGENMNPYRGGFLLIPENNKRIIPICKPCVLDLSGRDESFRIK